MKRRLFYPGAVLKKPGSASLLLLYLALFVTLFATLRAGLVPDEQNRMLMTKVLVEQDHLYLRFVDHQPPGQAIAGVPFYWLFGPTTLAAKSAVVFYTVTFSLAAGWIAYRLTGSRDNAAAAAGLSGFFAALYGLYIGVNVSSYSQIFFVMGAALALSTPCGRHGGWWALAGGLLIGFAFMTKPSVVLQGLPLLALVYVQRRAWHDVILVLAGAALMVGAQFLYFALDGTLYEMALVSFVMNLSYLGFLQGMFNYQVQGETEPRQFGLDGDLFQESLPFLAALIVIAVVMELWTLRHRRRLSAAELVALWALIAFVEALMPVAMAIRYFFGVFAPLAVLGTFSLAEARRSWVIRGALGLTAVLLVVSAVRIDRAYPLARQKHRANFQNSLALLDERLKPGECLLTWGWLSGLVYFSDHPSCSRIVIEGNMMPRGIYDVRPLQAWYFEDVVTTRPTLIARQSVWSFYPALQRLMNFRQLTEVGRDRRLAVRYFTLDWSTYHDGDAVINDELELMGYDLAPGGTVQPGDEITVVLYWKVKHVPAADYQGYVHVTLPGDWANKIATQDTLPTDPYIPMPDWWRGGIVAGREYRLTIPPETPPGSYDVIAGLYRLLPDGSFAPLDHRVQSTGESVPAIRLGTITVGAE